MIVAVRIALSIIAIVFALLLSAWFFDYDPPMRSPAFAAADIGEDLDTWVAGRERVVGGLVPGGEKQIVWAGEPGRRMPFSIVYMHGFSANPQEIRPVPDIVAKALNANIYFARLHGHALDGAALAAAQAQDWLEDFAEALAIGERLGDQIIVFGTSTGATIALAALGNPELRATLPGAENVAGLVFVSPNLRLRSAFSGFALDLPMTRYWLPLLFGKERRSAPSSEAVARNWTTTYPTLALLPLARIMRAARAADPGVIKAPLLLFYSHHDQVVNPDAALAVASNWGGPAMVVELPLGAGIDPNGHVLAGDIVSPAATQPVAERIIGWARQL